MKLIICLFVVSFGMAVLAKAQSATGRVASITDMEMYYKIHGEGEPLILLHGFTGSGAMWETILGDLGRTSTHYGFHSNSCITRYPVAVIPSRR